MSFNDPISDLLTRIRNAKLAKHKYVDIILSRMAKDILEVMKGKGFIQNYLVNTNKRTVRVFLKYSKKRESVIHNLKRVSKPGQRMYLGYKNILPVKDGLGTAILSTPNGVIDDEKARKEKVGGELLCLVW